MQRDEIYDKKLIKFRNELSNYISYEYLGQISSSHLSEFISYLKEDKKDEYMLDNILMSFAIEGFLTIDDIPIFKLHLEINKILFDEHIRNLLKNTNTKQLKIIKNQNIKKSFNQNELEMLVKNYITENIITLYNNNYKHISSVKFYLDNENNVYKLKLFDNKKVFKIIK